MLLPYTTLTYYGPGATSMQGFDSLGDAVVLLPRMEIRPSLDVLSTGLPFVFRPYRGRAFGINVLSQGYLHSAVPHQIKKPKLNVFVSELSQDDVAGALGNLDIEGGLTLKQALRLLLATMAGDATGLDGTAKVYKSAVDNSKTRVAGSIVAGTRTITTLDPD